MDTQPTSPVHRTPVKAEETEPRKDITRKVPSQWILPIGIAAGILVIVAAWLGIMFAPIPVLPADAIQPLFTVYPPPSFTPIPPTLTITPFITATPVIPTVQPGTIGIGAMVEVTGTGGDGLRLRDAPSKDGKILYLAGDHEMFTVVDGPREGDGYTWWLLQGVYDTSLQGWAVQNFLRPSS